jgi:hypothetical protein
MHASFGDFSVHWQASIPTIKKEAPAFADASGRDGKDQVLVDLSRFFFRYWSLEEIGLHLCAEAGVTFGDGFSDNAELDDLLGSQHRIRSEADVVSRDGALSVTG